MTQTRSLHGGGIQHGQANLVASSPLAKNDSTATESKAPSVIHVFGSSTGVNDPRGFTFNPDLPLPSIERKSSSASYSPTSSPDIARLRTPSFTVTPPPSVRFGSPLSSQTTHSPSPQPSGTIGELSNQIGSLCVNDDQHGTPDRGSSYPVDGHSCHSTPSRSVTPSGTSSADALAADMSDLALRATPPATGSSSSNLLEPSTADRADGGKKSPRRKSRDRRRSSSADVTMQHSVCDEIPPENRFHQPAFQAAIAQTEGLVVNIAKTIERSGLHNERDSSMAKLYAVVSEMTKCKPASSRVVGLVGDSGAGKSSLINSLLDVQDLARSSGSGAACTCVATEYLYHNRPDYTMHIEYFSADEVTAQFRALLEGYRLHKNSKMTSTNSDESSKDEAAALAQRADMAINTFRAAFGRHLDEDMLLKGSEHQALDQLMAQARTLQLTPVLGLNQDWSAEQFDTADECSKRLKDLTSESSNSKTPWPFIRKIKVFLNAHILSRGIILADLPGLRDLNSARVHVTERYLLSCHEIFAVCAIGRASTDVGVKEIFELAQRARLPKVGIICTKADQIRAREAENDWKGTVEAERVHDMLEELNEIATEMTEFDADLEELEQFSDSEAEQERLDLYQQKTRKEKDRNAKELALKAFIINTRNQKISTALEDKYTAEHPGVASEIFCVSNVDYWERRFKSRTEYLPYLELSGIVALRKHCLAIVAESQHQAAKEYMKDGVPSLLNSLDLWIEAGSGSLSAEKKQIVRDAMKSISEHLNSLTGPRSDCNRISKRAKRLFAEHVSAVMDAHVSQWARNTAHLARSWEALHHATYSAYCRKSGSHRYPSWNDEIVAATLAALKEPWYQLVTEVERVLNQTLCSTGDSLEAAVALVQPDVSCAKSIAVLIANIAHRSQLLRRALEAAFEDFYHQLNSLTPTVLTGIRTSILSQLLEPGYTAASLEHGTGSDRRRKNIITSHFSDRQLFSRHQRMTTNQFVDLVKSLEHRVCQVTGEHVSAIRGDIAIVEGDHVISEAERRPEFREQLKAEVEGRGQPWTWCWRVQSERRKLLWTQSGISQQVMEAAIAYF